jgi:uncharacterized LabA/DUF88 family protein
MFDKSEKIAVLVDGPSMNSVTYGLGMKIDYRALKMSFAKRGRLSALKYYTYVDSENPDNPLVKLLDWLEYNGYRVFRKSARVFEHEDGGRSVRGSISAELATDMVVMAANVDHIVLLTNGIDYVYPVSEVQRLGVRVTLVSSLSSEGFKVSDELRRVADQFVDLEDLRSEIELPSRALQAAE